MGDQKKRNEPVPGETVCYLSNMGDLSLQPAAQPRKALYGRAVACRKTRRRYATLALDEFFSVGR
jgi:hypothetical protein